MCTGIVGGDLVHSFLEIVSHFIAMIDMDVNFTS